MRVQKSILCILLCVVMGLGSVIPVKAAEAGGAETAMAASRCPDCGRLGVYEYSTEVGLFTRYEKCPDKTHVDVCSTKIVYVQIYNVKQCSFDGCDYVELTPSGIREVARVEHTYIV